MTSRTKANEKEIEFLVRVYVCSSLEVNKSDQLIEWRCITFPLLNQLNENG